MSSEATLHDAAIILSKLANCSQLFSLPGVFPTIQSPPSVTSTTKNGNVIVEDLAIIEASTSRLNPNQLTSSSTSKKNLSKRKKNSSKSPREFRGRSRGRSQSRSRTRSNSVGGNNNHIVQHQLTHPNQQNLMMNRQVSNSNNSQQSSGRRSSSSNGGKHIKFVLNNIPQTNQHVPKQQSIVPYVPRVYTNSGFSRNNHHQQSQNQIRPQRDRSISESMAYNNQNINPLRSNQQRNQPRIVQQKHLQSMKPGMSNDFVSREIMDYYQRNRQTNEKYKAKQILRQSLENTLKQSFPTYFINLHIIGSTTNGIGDNVSAVDICVLSRKKPIMTRVPPSSPVSTNGDSAATNDTPNEEDEPITSIKNLVENDFKKEDNIVVAPADSNTIAKDNDGNAAATAAASNSMEQKDDELTLKSIEKILQNKNFAQNIILIPARVPVIKFKDIICNLDVTLNLNQEMSIRNTQLIRDYSKMDWRFPPLATIVKQWARENRINCAVEKSISPYSWTLMVIHYLQVCDPPVLPCLQRMHSKRYDINVSIEEEMNAWRQSPGKWFSKNNSTLKQLLKGLFRYYGYNFDYDKYVISVREGKVLERFKLQSSINSKRNTNNGAGTLGGSSENNPTSDNAIQWNSLMCVEEPFTRNNTTRSVHDPETFERIRELLRMSSNALKGNRISLYNIIIDDLDFPVKY